MWLLQAVITFIFSFPPSPFKYLDTHKMSKEVQIGLAPRLPPTPHNDPIKLKTIRNALKNIVSWYQKGLSSKFIKSYKQHTNWHP